MFRKFIKIAFPIAVIILLALFAFQEANAEELLVDTESTLVEECTITSALSESYQELEVEDTAYAQTVSVTMKKSSPFASGNFSLSFYVDDELKDLEFYDIGDMPTGYHEVSMALDNTYVSPDTNIKLYIVPTADLFPHAVKAIAENNNYAGKTKCNDFFVLDDWDVKLWGLKKQTFDLFSFISIAHASTSCEFVMSGATTTAECSDPIISIPVQDTFNGIILFIVTTVVFLLGFEYLNNKRKRFND